MKFGYSKMVKYHDEFKEFRPRSCPGQTEFYKLLFHLLDLVLFISVFIAATVITANKWGEVEKRRIVERWKLIPQDAVMAPAITVCPKFYPYWLPLKQMRENTDLLEADLPETVKDVMDSLTASSSLQDTKGFLESTIAKMKPDLDPNDPKIEGAFPDYFDFPFFKISKSWLIACRPNGFTTEDSEFLLDILLGNLFCDQLTLMMNQADFLTVDKRMKTWVRNYVNNESTSETVAIEDIVGFVSAVMDAFALRDVDFRMTNDFILYMNDGHFSDLLEDWPSTEGPGCQTEDGHLCEFPFKYENITYNGCMYWLDGIYKCPTDIFSDGSVYSLDTCNMDNCSVDFDGSDDDSSFSDEIKTCKTVDGLQCVFPDVEQGFHADNCFWDSRSAVMAEGPVCNTAEISYTPEHLRNLFSFATLDSLRDLRLCSVDCYGIEFFSVLEEGKQLMLSMMRLLIDLFHKECLSDLLSQVESNLTALTRTNIRGGNTRLLNSWIEEVNVLHNELSTRNEQAGSCRYLDEPAPGNNASYHALRLEMEETLSFWNEWFPIAIFNNLDMSKYPELITKMFALYLYGVFILPVREESATEKLNEIFQLYITDPAQLSDDVRSELVNFDIKHLRRMVGETLDTDPLYIETAMQHLLTASFSQLHMYSETWDGNQFFFANKENADLDKPSLSFVQLFKLVKDFVQPILWKVNVYNENWADKSSMLFPLCWDEEEDVKLYNNNSIMSKYVGCAKLQPRPSTGHLCYTYNDLDLNEIWPQSSWMEAFVDVFRIEELTGYKADVRDFGFVYNYSIKDDIFGFSKHMIPGFFIKAHAPGEDPGFHSWNLDSWTLIEPSSQLFQKFELTASVLLEDVSSEVEEVAIEERNCYLPHEARQLKLFATYSQENCMAECAWEKLFSTCKCLPWFVPNHPDSTTICSGEGEACARNFWRTEEPPDCQCLPTCRRTTYTLNKRVQQRRIWVGTNGMMYDSVEMDRIKFETSNYTLTDERINEHIRVTERGSDNLILTLIGFDNDEPLGFEKITYVQDTRDDMASMFGSIFIILMTALLIRRAVTTIIWFVNFFKDMKAR